MAAEPMYRTRTDRLIAGVCGGVARHYNVDPTIVRVVLAVFTVFMFGIGIVAYLVAWLVMPDEPWPAPERDQAADGEPGGVDSSRTP